MQYTIIFYHSAVLYSKLDSSVKYVDHKCVYILFKIQIHPGTKIYVTNEFGGLWSLEPMWHQVRKIGDEFMRISSVHPEGFHVIGNKNIIFRKFIISSFYLYIFICIYCIHHYCLHHSIIVTTYVACFGRMHITDSFPAFSVLYIPIYLRAICQQLFGNAVCFSLIVVH